MPSDHEDTAIGRTVHSGMIKHIHTLFAILSMAILSAAAQAKVVTETIEYKDGDVTLKGYLAYDDAAKQPAPGVLVCPEWWGLNDYAKKRAEMIAGLGYVAFAIDYYGDGKVAATREEAQALSAPFYAADEKTGRRELMRSRVLAGLKALKGFKQVDATRLASIGYCLGGTVSLELSRTAAEGENLKAIVSFHGGLSQTNTDDAKGIKASLLVCHGAIDPFISAEEFNKFKAEMDNAKVDYQIVSYAKAVHSFTNPGVDAKNIDGAKYNANADHRSWEAMKTFLAERLAKADAKKADEKK